MVALVASNKTLEGDEKSPSIQRLQQRQGATQVARIGQNIWQLKDVIEKYHVIPPQYFECVPAEVIQNFQTLLSRDVFSEGDSQQLYRYVLAREGDMSEAFINMLSLWQQDELKHYEGLRRVYYSLTNISYSEMDRIFAARVHDIEPIKCLLEDEFLILLSLMFDEIGSVYSYRRDLQEYYRHFDVAIRKMGHHLVRDEGMHFNNAAELLLSLHADRLCEVPACLEMIVQLESRLQTYHKTFFLDHAQERHRFPSHFNSVIVQVILARLGLGPKPSQAQVRSLWQWKPAGHTLVPV